jgi:hypothetical protein
METDRLTSGLKSGGLLKNGGCCIYKFCTWWHECRRFKQGVAFFFKFVLVGAGNVSCVRDCYSHKKSMMYKL